jgi:hypothetical protein
MVCGVNFLFPFFNKPEALASMLRPIFPDLQIMLPIEDGKYVAMEWIGQENYLGEIKSPNRKRSRGALFTSADAAVMFEHQDGRRQFVLIEWKYTEAYFSTPLHTAKSGTKRTDIYRHLYNADDCPLNKELLPSYDDLFYEVFYQFMRQQFLANEMEKATELGADIVSLLHIAPEANRDFKRITSPDLRDIAESATGVWNKLVQKPDRFVSISTETLFGKFDTSGNEELSDWWNYISSRYRWVKVRQDEN